jgi:methionyl-tRNA formyltransferase
VRIVFFGIWRLGELALETAVSHGHEVGLVVTRAGAPGNPQPVAVMAERLGMVVATPERLKTDEFHAALSAARPELIVVAGFHKRIPESVLQLAPGGAINVHPSLLPAYRGPTPYKHALIQGETMTGATVHAMTAEFDKGAILTQLPLAIDEDDDSETLFHKSAVVCAEALGVALSQIASGTAVYREQDESRASYYPALTEGDCRIDWSWPAARIRNLVRGVTPRPGAWAMIEGHRWRCRGARLTGEPSTAAPGTLLMLDDAWVRIATGSEDVDVELLPDEGGG